MNPDLTVLHAVQPTDAGVDGYVAAVAADQLARGWRVMVACPCGGRLAADLAARGIPRLHWPATRAPGADTRRCPGAELCIVGDGSLLPTLRGWTSPGVRFVAPVADPRPWYAAADVVVLPSRWEGLPLTLLEALASGCPVVVSDIPGLTDAITAGVGAQVPVGDTGALADAVARRLIDCDLRVTEASAARLAAGAFDVQHTHEQLAAVTAQIAVSALR